MVRILAVEDDSDVLRSLSEILEAVNAAVVELESGGGEPAGTHSNAVG
jgi:CheY-like chemotaxis protein